MILHILLPMSMIAMIPTGTSSLDLGMFGDYQLDNGIREYEGSHDLVLGGEAAAEGWVELDAKLDLRALYAKLEKLPGILYTLRNLTTKVNSLDQEAILVAILPTITALKKSSGSELVQLQVTIREMFDGLQRGLLSSNEEKVLRILSILEGFLNKPVKCEMSELEKLFRKLAGGLERNVLGIEQQIRTEISKEDQELQIANRNSEVLSKILKLIERISGQFPAFGGGDCVLCAALHDLQSQAMESFSLIKTLYKEVNILPEAVIVALQSEATVGSLMSDLITLVKSKEAIKADLASLNSLVRRLSNESEQYFKEHASMTMEMVFMAKESAKAIQSSSQQTVHAVQTAAQDVVRTARSVGRSCD